MFNSADVLISNLLTLGAALLVLLLLGVVAARLFARGVGPLLRRLDRSGELDRRWTAQFTRVFALVSSLLGLLLLTGALALSYRGIDAQVHLRGWATASLIADPRATAVVAGKLLAVLIGAPAVYFVLRGFLRSIGDVLARTTFAARRPELDLLIVRLQGTARWVCLLVGLRIAAAVVTDAEQVHYALAVATYLIVGVSLARSIVAAAHLTIDLAFDLSRSLAGLTTPLRYLGRLQRLAGVTRRVADCFICVGVATVVCAQLAPGTALAEWGQIAIRVIAILYVSRVVVEVVEVMLREALAAPAPGASEADHGQRQTLVPVATSLARYAIYIFSIAMALGELGLDTTPLFAVAGLMGIAVGLGAQAIVSDLVSGFFILFENIFLVGHRVQVGDYTGVVEELGVRVTKVRDDFGALHSIPNGEIRSVTSYSQQFVNAVVEFGVPHEEDLPRVFAAVQARIGAVRGEHPAITGDTAIVVQELRETSLWIRTVTRCAPGQDDNIGEMLRYEIATALAGADIRPPHAYRVVRQSPPLAAPRSKDT